MRPEIGKDQSAERLHRVVLDLDIVLEAAFGMGNLLERLLEAVSLGVEQPAVIGAAQAFLFRDAVFERHAAMRAAIVDEPQFAALAAEERQVFAEYAYALYRKRCRGTLVASISSPG